MVKVNWDEGAASGGKPLFRNGNYLVEVAQVVQKVSKKGDDMFEITFTSVDFDFRTICKDYIMLGGNGLPMGLRRLKALGFKKGDDDINAATVVGRRCYAAITTEVYKDQKQNKVDGSAKGSNAGYWSEKSPPDKVVSNGAAPTDGGSTQDDGTVPF